MEYQGDAPFRKATMHNQELEQHITNAADSPTDPAYDLVLAALKGKQLYVKLLSPADGTPDRPTLETVQVGPLRCIRLYTTRDHPALGAPFGGLVWEAAVEMLGKVKDVTGVKIVNRADNWVCFGKDIALESVQKNALAHTETNV